MSRAGKILEVVAFPATPMPRKIGASFDPNTRKETSTKPSRANEVLSQLSEIRAIRSISYRGGKRHKRVACPAGYRLERPRGSGPMVMGRCKRQGAVERRRRSISGKRRARRMRGRTAVIVRKRKRTTRRRTAAGL